MEIKSPFLFAVVKFLVGQFGVLEKTLVYTDRGLYTEVCGDNTFLGIEIDLVDMAYQAVYFSRVGSLKPFLLIFGKGYQPGYDWEC